jgi:polysaccharide export outer membrane protein
MKKTYLVITLLVISLSSCLPTKKTNYFQGEPTTKGEMYKLNNEPYRLQVNDVLSIQIKSENPELVSLFNASKTEGTVSSKGDGLYFDGYTINTHGNIRIPYIGELNVLGYTEREVREKIEFELENFIKNLESIFVTVKLS